MSCFFFFNDTATTEIYTLSLHDALPICHRARAERLSARRARGARPEPKRRAARCRARVTRLSRGAFRGGRPTVRRNARSEEHTSELQSLAYLVCRLLLVKKKPTKHTVRT